MHNLLEKLIVWNTLTLIVLALLQLPLLYIFLRVMRERPRSDQARRQFPNQHPVSGKMRCEQIEDAASDGVSQEVEGEPPPPGRSPRVALVLCLRGQDPFLEACLRAALRQSYDNYQLKIVLDSDRDSAWPVVESVLRQTDRSAEILFLDEIPVHCGLKCSSLLHACRSLDEAIEFVAILDADTHPHESWLSELMAPFADPNVGATTGNRWYTPRKFSWPSLQRYLWNTHAVVQMVCFKIPWGGTLAIRCSVLKDSDLMELWSRALCEDTLVYSALKKLGLQLKFVPGLVLANQEDCGFGELCAWIRRQLVVAWLYHPHAIVTVIHGLVIAVFWYIAGILLVAALAAGNLPAAALAVAGPILHLVILMGHLPLLERTVVERIRHPHPKENWMKLGTVIAMPFAAFAFQTVYPAILISALLARRIRWRRVDYDVSGPFAIRRLNYCVYSDQDRRDEHSL